MNIILVTVHFYFTGETPVAPIVSRGSWGEAGYFHVERGANIMGVSCDVNQVSAAWPTRQCWHMRTQLHTHAHE